ncbi:hypothetical protein B7463_g4627, partial [Scytalidium lignicola]
MSADDLKLLPLHPQREFAHQMQCDRLLAGLSSGSLLVYRVHEIPDIKESGTAKQDNSYFSRPGYSSASKIHLLIELEKFSTKAIDQLARIKEANALVSLSNSSISIHDLQTYTLQEQLMETKGASSFAVTSNIVEDPATKIPEIISRLAVAVKKRLLLWSWHESELSQKVTEILLVESIHSLTWALATKIICGMNSGYVIVDVVSNNVENMVTPGGFRVSSASMGYIGLGGYAMRPRATRLGDGEILLVKDVNSLFITSDGKPLDKGQVPWQESPIAVGYSHPYILSLQTPSKSTLEIRNPDTLSLLQVISPPGARILHLPPPTASLTHTGKGFYVASSRCVWRMDATDYGTQVDGLIKSQKYDEAISVVAILEEALLKNKEERLREIKIQNAQMLFDQREYASAMEIVSAVEAPPETVISLYPTVVAGNLSKLGEKYAGTESDHEESRKNTKGYILTVGESHQNSSKQTTASTSLVSYYKTNPDSLSARSPVKSKGDGANYPASTFRKISKDGRLEKEDLINAVLNLISFLVDTRTRMMKFLDTKTGKLIPPKDTKYNVSSPGATKSVFVAPASSTEKDWEKKLRETAQLVDTTLFRCYILA